jgi:tRNA(Arg) A34 adenosine deaminase TadA
MQLAIAEACLSHREGNHGFGAVIVHGENVVAQTHDTEELDQDPTAHAELKAIRVASKKVGKDLSGCSLICIHEPCPMCATAVVWSKISTVAYGYGISDAILQGRNRIDIECTEIFSRAKADIQVIRGLMSAECSILYDRSVRAEIRKLRGASDDQLLQFDKDSTEKRRRWFEEERLEIERVGDNPLLKAYQVLLKKLGIKEGEAPIIRRNDEEIVFRSMNSCPTLEACKVLGLEPRKICKLYNEGATDALEKLVDPRLEFSRNYARMRPEYEYCEEIIRYKAK